MEPIILASASPRRQEILTNLNIPFKIMFPDADESIPEDVTLENIPEYLATKKVQSVVKMFPPEQTIPWILGADTAIICKDKLYGKPGSAAEAEEFLHTFSGHTHQVISAIALFNGKLNYLDTKVSVNQVTFKHLTDKEIQWYLDTDEWHGVAGGYRIQGKAQLFIKNIKGSYSSIMGLSISDFYEIMQAHNYSIIE